MKQPNTKAQKKRIVRKAKAESKAAKEKTAKVAKKEAAVRKKTESPAAIARFERRKAFVEAVNRGEPVALAARLHNFSSGTAFRLLSRYQSSGMAGLKDKARSGRPSKLTPKQMQWLCETITKQDPRQLKFEYALWTLAIIKMAIMVVHGVDLNKSTVWRILRSMNLSPQVPTYKSYKQNPGRVKNYLKTRYPAAVKWAESNGAEIYFADESRVRADGQSATTWGKVGETPIVEDSGNRFGINMFSAVSNSGAMFFRCFEDSMNGAKFIEFLRDLQQTAGHTILVIVDNGSVHKSAPVKKFLKEEGRTLGIKVVYLPPYSPELNPDEQVWNQAKRDLGKRIVKTKNELKDVVNQVLTKMQSAVDLVKSFFRMEKTLYAALPNN